MVDSSRESIGDVSRPRLGDVVRAGVDSGLNIVPFGGAIPPLLALVCAPPLQKRRDAYIQDLSDRITRLEESGIVTREELQTNEDFATAVYHGIRSAVSTAAAEKQEALRNVALNVALKRRPEEDLFEMFLRYVDEFTPLHIELLTFFDDPSLYADSRHLMTASRTRSQFLEEMKPRLAGEGRIYAQAWAELWARGLVSTESLGGQVSEQGLEQSLTTDLGKQFVQFIATPPEEQQPS